MSLFQQWYHRHPLLGSDQRRKSWSCSLPYPHNRPLVKASILFCVFIAVLLATPGSSVEAAVPLEVEVSGITEPLLGNVNARLGILLHKDKPQLHVGAMRRLHHLAEEDIRSALAPFGYYNPLVKGSLVWKAETWYARYDIHPGQPVLIDEVEVRLLGEGRENSGLQEALSAFSLKKGDVLDQKRYEEEKKRLINVAFGEGFLQASFSERSLRIDRDRNSGSISLFLDSGPQYRFGPTASRQLILDGDLLQRYLPYQPGDPYRPAKLFELQSILYQTSYFSRVAVRGQVDLASDQAIPVEVDLEGPQHRNKYSLGMGYATDTGARVKVDWDNRLFNSAGHQAKATLQVGQLENVLAFHYRLPLHQDPRHQALTGSLAYQDKEWDGTTTQLFTASLSRDYSGPRYRLGGGVELRDEIYDVGETSGESLLLLPSLNVGAIFSDDLLNTKNGLQVSLGVIGGVEGIVSDVTFVQTTASGKAIISPFPDWRLIGRGSLGVIAVDSIDSLPPSLRFYTGGDNSLRGYGYKSIGTEDASGTNIGGRYLVVGSIEAERLVYHQWSLAAFWDVGTATDDLNLDFFQGVGGGVRFRLPFGQIRLDVASAITEDGTPLRIHFTVGGDF
jgi:translocation and assembly module TamA